MEPVTHFLTGACLARAGFNRKAAYATVAMTLAAEMPDIDVLWGFRGPVAAFEHHRGITHTFVGLPFEAAVLVGVFWGAHQVLSRRVRRSAAVQTEAPRQRTDAPVRWGVLYGFALVALLSHLLLDWTNNYGLRPFFPFNPRWYAGSFVFIVEPLMLLFLGVALVAPALFGLIAGEVGARRPRFRGRGWAIAALLAIACLWAVRFAEHDVALQLAANAAYGAPGASTPAVLRVTASPSPVDPFAWHTVAETPGFYQLARVDSRRGVVETDASADLLFKPPTSVSTLIAKRSSLGRVYLDWSSWPLITDIGPAPLPSSLQEKREPEARSHVVSAEVTFRDLRFLYDVPTTDWRRSPPLGGEVYVDLTQPESGRVAAMVLSGNVQR